MAGGFDYRQFMNMYRGLDRVNRNLNAWLHDFLLTEALRTLRLVRPLTPVDTGLLRRSWSISNVERTGYTLVVYLINPVEYASFQENGFQYKTKDGYGWYPGHHMAEISIQKVQQAMPARFEREFARWLRTVGWR